MLAGLLLVVPYLAVVAFLAGFTWRVLGWAAAPVPFRIPTTAGQQKSLSFLGHARIENPAGWAGVVARVALDALLFRSLFRNTSHRRHAGLRLSYPEQKSLWAAALAFHWSLLVILVRHLRLLAEPVPAVVNWVTAADGFFHVGTPGLYISDVAVLAALAYLLLRRVREPLLRYFSLPADYAALVLLLAIAVTGVTLRHWVRPDVVAIKQFALGLVVFHPLAAGVPASGWFAAHLLLVCALLAVFPFTKLMHAAGAFLSPTRVMANSNRRVRHVNPWNAPVEVHTYAEWEGEFRDKIRAAGLPLDEQGLKPGSTGEAQNR
jgi:nitrate reductase gamma subunit